MLKLLSIVSLPAALWCGFFASVGATSAEPAIPTPIVLPDPPNDIAQAQPDDDIAQAQPDDGVAPASDSPPLAGPLELLGEGVLFQEGSETSGRLRGTVFYPINDSLLLGAEADVSFGDAFADSEAVNLHLNELYAAYAPKGVPELRFVVGLMDLTSYFDRNSFAKDKTTHFFNSVFETNPALSAVGIGSTPGLLINWSPVDALEFKAASFSSSRDIGEWAMDAFAGEVGLRWENVILRGTYSNAREADRNSGFEEIFQFNRGDGQFGLREGDREEAFGLNAEAFVPSLQLGLFGRYGHYRNQDLGEGGDTYSFGLNWLDMARAGDRLGLGYGRALSQDALRQERGDRLPDVLEMFYDFPITGQTRAALSVQGREEFSEMLLGFRVKTRF